MLLVSSCLLGECCKYNGGHNYSEAVAAYVEEHGYITACPEKLGDLPTPRPPAEISGQRVLDAQGQDVTAEFMAGARATLALAQEYGVDTAILRDQSPSCGVHKVYDGSFSGTLKTGRGITAALLRASGIKIMSENDV